MERALNRRQQGDLGEAAALSWLTSIRAIVYLPFGHSPDVDLVAELEGQLLRVQVKSSVQSLRTPDGHLRWAASVATRGGNQSWNRTAKLLDTERIDFLFVLVGDGRRWFIPAAEIEARSALNLGGPKYSEFEVGPASTLESLVYSQNDAPLESRIASLGEYPSGQRMATVNRPAQPSKVRILPPPLEIDAAAGGRIPSGQTRISANRQIVIPKRAFDAAALERGERLKAYVVEPGTILFKRLGRAESAASPVESAQGQLSSNM